MFLVITSLVRLLNSLTKNALDLMWEMSLWFQKMALALMGSVAGHLLTSTQLLRISGSEAPLLSVKIEKWQLPAVLTVLDLPFSN